MHRVGGSFLSRRSRLSLNAKRRPHSRPVQILIERIGSTQTSRFPTAAPPLPGLRLVAIPIRHCCGKGRRNGRVKFPLVPLDDDRIVAAGVQQLLAVVLSAAQRIPGNQVARHRQQFPGQFPRRRHSLCPGLPPLLPRNPATTRRRSGDQPYSGKLRPVQPPQGFAGHGNGRGY